ncbi:MAG: IclR family transcriptional regulator [Chloroflexota bacterium]
MKSVQSVERAFTILQTISENPDGIGAAEIAKAINLPRPTVIRLLNTMQNVQAVERLPDEATYRIGESIRAISATQSSTQQLINIARPFLLQLAQQTKESVYLSVPEGLFVHYIDQINSQYHIQPSNWVGRNVPLHLVSDGKIYLSTWTTAKLNSYLNGPFVTTPAYKKLTQNELLEKIEAIHQTGFAHSRNEFEEGLVAYSAPIKNQDGKIIAAVTIDGPAYRFPKEKTKIFAKLVMNTSEAISSKLIR